MRVSIIGYDYANSGWLMSINGIKYCDRFLYNNILKFKDNGFRLFGGGL